ncbi:hypothetical protein D8674_036137 [Pyrus ussuriensis x Pyrus communis]|uniref:Uncharacterized protein n=1 Tax=Pyrus ussuriensis x Pyrus communis TaxID=2448454 RepID=A0A5N5GIX3_9ROSA|nr:hypothetical protein D8674_036137 [Pyrus ussuriensis x Pyrus communis]
MGEFAAAGALLSVGHCQPSFCPGRGMCFGPENVKGKPIKNQERIFRAEAVLKSKKTKQHREPLTFYFRYTFDAPLNESPATMMADRKSNALLLAVADYEKLKKEKLKTAEEWRIHMPAMQVLFLSVYLALYVKLRCKSMGKDYPPHVPHHISKIIELDIARWEIRGIAGYDPSDINLNVTGTIFADRQGTQSWLRNIFDINLSFIVPPLLAWVPDNAMRSITESLVKTVMTDLKSNAILLAVVDYEKFKKEKLKTAV